MPWKPRVDVVTLAASTLSSDLMVHKGTRRVDINPRTTTIEVQVAFEGGLGNTAPNFVQLVDGQSYTLVLDAFPNGAPDDIKLSFFAAAAVTVDVVSY